MRLSNYLFIAVVCFGLMFNVAANNTPIIREAGSSVVVPSVFLIEGPGGAAADLSDWIAITLKQYYIDACETMNKEISSRKPHGIDAGQAEHTLLLLESDAKKGILPRWVENIFIVCKDSETIVSFFARSGGWAEANNGALSKYSDPAYICTIDPKTKKITSNSNRLKAIVYANLYPFLAKNGIITDYAQKPGFIAPLNPSKDNKYYKVQVDEE